MVEPESDVKPLQQPFTSNDDSTILHKDVSIRTNLSAQIRVRSSDPSEPLTLKTFGRYTIEKELGKGGMGVVYLAEDTLLHRRVALKVPKRSALEDPEVLERFYREAHAAAKLRHPNICPVFDVGAIDGTHYITMPYIPGKPISSYVRKERLPEARQVALLIRKIAIAVDMAHKNGVVHRDLKPSNIMLDEQREPIVMDFGLARLLNAADNARLTQTGAIIGTPAYMAPEQVRSEFDQIGPATDIYALGVIFYQFLTGELPYAGTSLMVFSQIVTEQPKKPSELRSDVDPTLEAICLKMMSKDITHRYSSMQEVAVMLTEYLRSAPTVEPLGAVDIRPKDSDPPQMAATPPKFGRRSWHARPWFWPSVGLLVLLPAIAIVAAVVNLSNRLEMIAIRLDDPTATLNVDGKLIAVDANGFGGVRLDAGIHHYSVMRGTQVVRESIPFEVTRRHQSALSITTLDRPTVSPVSNPSTDAAPATPQLAVFPFDAQLARRHQEAWARHLNVPLEFTNSLDMKFILIPPGEFKMGTASDEIENLIASHPYVKQNLWTNELLRSEGPQQRASVSDAFYIGVHEVTNSQFQAFAEAAGYQSLAERSGGGNDWVYETSQIEQRPEFNWRNSRQTANDEHPVRFLALEDADAFVKWLSETCRGVYSIPSATQWEFACRAGTQTKWYFGDDETLAEQFEWMSIGRHSAINPVGKKRQNPFGLLDMSGNVAELVLDQGKVPFMRGGSTISAPIMARSASRYPAQEIPGFTYGLRVVLNLRR